LHFSGTSHERGVQIVRGVALRAIAAGAAPHLPPAGAAPSLLPGRVCAARDSGLAQTFAATRAAGHRSPA